MPKQPDTIAERIAAEIGAAPEWLNNSRVIGLVFFASLILAYFLTPNLPDLFLALIASLLIIELVFERTIGRRAVKRFAAKRRRHAERQETEKAADDAELANLSRRIFRLAILWGIAIAMVLATSHFMLLTTNNPVWIIGILGAPLLAVVHLFPLMERTDTLENYGEFQRSNPGRKSIVDMFVRPFRTDPLSAFVEFTFALVLVLGATAIFLLDLGFGEIPRSLLLGPVAGSVIIVGAIIGRWTDLRAEKRRG